MNSILNLPRKALRKIRVYWRTLWVRVVLMGLLAIVAIGASQLIAAMLPGEIRGMVKGQAADRLLNLIANAMLAVTTFSLTVMVTVYRASSSQFTPRIHQLIRQDPTTQNTLATFIGAYVYALTAIVMREVGFYGDDRALSLFYTTVLVLGLIVWSLVRWVQHLQTLGSLIDSCRQLELITARQFRQRLSTPCLGATPLTGSVPEDGITIVAPSSGYIREVHPEQLQSMAEEEGVEVYFLEHIGSFVFMRTPLVRITGLPDDVDEDVRKRIAKRVRANIEIGDERTYEQDPRFGLQTMSEIASRALSPGVNDPGTALDLMNRSGRVLSYYRDETAQGDSPVLPLLHVRPLAAGDLIDDAFSAIARDGAALLEVQARLQRVLAGLMRHPDKGLCAAARNRAEEYAERANAAMQWGPDRDRLSRVLAVTKPKG